MDILHILLLMLLLLLGDDNVDVAKCHKHLGNNFIMKSMVKNWISIVMENWSIIMWHPLQPNETIQLEVIMITRCSVDMNRIYSPVGLWLTVWEWNFRDKFYAKERNLSRRQWPPENFFPKSKFPAKPEMTCYYPLNIHIIWFRHLIAVTLCPGHSTSSKFTPRVNWYDNSVD